MPQVMQQSQLPSNREDEQEVPDLKGAGVKKEKAKAVEVVVVAIRIVKIRVEDQRTPIEARLRVHPRKTQVGILVEAQVSLKTVSN